MVMDSKIGREISWVILFKEKYKILWKTKKTKRFIMTEKKDKKWFLSKSSK